jgi:amidohydrolase
MRGLRTLGVAAGFAALLSGFGAPSAYALSDAQVEAVRAAAAREQPKVVAWRRDIHAHPELANNEVRTAKLVADHLRKLGLEVRTGVAGHGVVGVLRGGKPGGVVALRADMDALPVLDQTGLPFASHATGTFNGQTVPVAHACGHDGHVAMLMGAAEILASMKADIPGTVVFIFQPAEEGAPAGERGGAQVMVEQGALENPHPTAIFGIHSLKQPANTLWYRPGPLMAAADQIQIKLKGKQTHGAWPWQGIDIVGVGSQIVTALHSVAARQMDVRIPLVLTIATFNAGVRYNIIPEEATLTGTLRTFDDGQRADVKQRIIRTVKDIADAWGATADVSYIESGPVTRNDPALADEILPDLRLAAGDPAAVDNAILPTTVSEDFSYYQQKIPGVFIFLGVTPPGVSQADAPPNHSPMFDTWEPAMETGVRTHILLALGYLERHRG